MLSAQYLEQPSTPRVDELDAIAASDEHIKRLGELDSKDVAEATPEEMAMFAGRHIPAPSAEKAGKLPSWWKGRRDSEEG